MPKLLICSSSGSQPSCRKPSSSKSHLLWKQELPSHASSFHPGTKAYTAPWHSQDTLLVTSKTKGQKRIPYNKNCCSAAILGTQGNISLSMMSLWTILPGAIIFICRMQTLHHHLMLILNWSLTGWRNSRVVKSMSSGGLTAGTPVPTLPQTSWVKCANSLNLNSLIFKMGCHNYTYFTGLIKPSGKNASEAYIPVPDIWPMLCKGYCYLLWQQEPRPYRVFYKCTQYSEVLWRRWLNQLWLCGLQVKSRESFKRYGALKSSWRTCYHRGVSSTGTPEVAAPPHRLDPTVKGWAHFKGWADWPVKKLCDLFMDCETKW